MSSLRKTKKLNVKIDFNYHFNKFVNLLMRDGKKYVALRLVYSVLKLIRRLLGINPYLVLDVVIKKLKPFVDVRVKRVIARTYYMPFLILNEAKALSLSFKWLIKFARERSEKGLHVKLAYEIIDVYLNKGESLLYRNNLQLKAIQGISFLHYLA